MSWNYRVVETKTDTQFGVMSRLGIHEVFYDEDGNVNGWTADPVDVSWCPEDLEDPNFSPEVILDRMRKALKLPIIRG